MDGLFLVLFCVAAFAGGVPSFEEDDDLLPVGDHPVLQLYELALQPEELLEVAMALCLFVIRRDSGALWSIAVFDLELELLIVAVDEIATESSQQFVVINRGGISHRWLLLGITLVHRDYMSDL